MDKNTEAIYFRLPEKLYKELKDMADSKNINLSSMVRIILTEYIKQNK